MGRIAIAAYDNKEQMAVLKELMQDAQRSGTVAHTVLGQATFRVANSVGEAIDIARAARGSEIDDMTVIITPRTSAFLGLLFKRSTDEIEPWYVVTSQDVRDTGFASGTREQERTLKNQALAAIAHRFDLREEFNAR